MYVYCNSYQRKTNPNKNQFRQNGITYIFNFLWLQGNCYFYLCTIHTYKHDTAKLIRLQIFIPDVRNFYIVAALMSVTVFQYPLTLLQPAATKLSLITNTFISFLFDKITHNHRNINNRIKDQMNNKMVTKNINLGLRSWLKRSVIVSSTICILSVSFFPLIPCTDLNAFVWQLDIT
jgi:hypothetical protein